MQILSNPLSALNVCESPKFSRFTGNRGRGTRWWRQILDRKWKYSRLVQLWLLLLYGLFPVIVDPMPPTWHGEGVAAWWWHCATCVGRQHAVSAWAYICWQWPRHAIQRIRQRPALHCWSSGATAHVRRRADAPCAGLHYTVGCTCMVVPPLWTSLSKELRKWIAAARRQFQLDRRKKEAYCAKDSPANLRRPQSTMLGRNQDVSGATDHTASWFVDHFSPKVKNIKADAASCGMAVEWVHR